MLRNLTTPAECLDDQVVEITGRYPGHPRRLGEGRGADAFEFLTCFGRERAQLGVGKIRRERERRELRQASRRLSLALEISGVLDLDFDRGDDIIGRVHADTGGLEQLTQSHTWSPRHG